jgi:aspartyl protease family protein
MISSDSLGQYWIRGAINNRFTNFLVDTGASVVAISAVHARQLGIEFDESHQGTVQTAQGTADTHFVTLDEIVVGGITAHNVRAAIIEGEYPLEPLLGMSFLRQVSLQENAGVLTLTKQH